MWGRYDKTEDCLQCDAAGGVGIESRAVKNLDYDLTVQSWKNNSKSTEPLDGTYSS